jgi:predicted kinase
VARALAPDIGPAPGALVLRSDEIRKRLHHAGPQVRLPPQAYTEGANQATNDALVELSRVAAASGHAVIADATFLDLDVRRRLRDVAAETGVPFLGVWLQAELSVLERRVEARAGDASDATVAVLRRAAQDDPGPGDWLLVDAGDGSQAAEIVRQAVRAAAPGAFASVGAGAS